MDLIGPDSIEIEDNYNNLISNDISEIVSGNDELKKYDVQVEISEVTRRVFRVTCTEIK